MLAQLGTIITAAAMGFQLWIDARPQHRQGLHLQPPESAKDAEARAITDTVAITPTDDMATQCNHLLDHCGFDRVLLSDADTVSGLPAKHIIFTSEPEGLDRHRRLRLADGATLGVSVSASSPERQKQAMGYVGSVEWLHVAEDAAAPMITAENLLAAAQGSPTRLAVSVRRASEVNGLAFALSAGVDAVVCGLGCVLESRELLEAVQIAKAQRLERDAAAVQAEQSEAAVGGRVQLEAAVLTQVADGGVADRVALDFTSLLGTDEGCLVGSSAKALAFVHGETVASGFVPPRPFRCNAGPVHAYVMMADGSVKYLSEVRAGDEVLAVSLERRTCRALVVGRCKVERRPMLLLRFESTDGSRSGQTFLQQAETVRVASSVSTALPVTRASGSRESLLVRWSEQGTHVGKAIRVQVDEK